MHTYRLYFYGPDSHLAEALPFECGDDEGAIKIAREKADDRAMELWQLARKVMDFPAAPKREQSERRRLSHVEPHLDAHGPA